MNCRGWWGWYSIFSASSNWMTPGRPSRGLYVISPSDWKLVTRGMYSNFHPVAANIRQVHSLVAFNTILTWFKVPALEPQRKHLEAIEFRWSSYIPQIWWFSIAMLDYHWGVRGMHTHVEAYSSAHKHEVEWRITFAWCQIIYCVRSFLVAYPYHGNNI